MGTKSKLRSFPDQTIFHRLTCMHSHSVIRHLRSSSRERNVPGKVIRGSTRPIMEAATSRSKVQGMMNELDDNNRLIEMQRIEIGRLREQVTVMLGQEGGGGGGRGMTDTYLVEENGEVTSELPPGFVMSQTRQSQSQPLIEQRFSPPSR